MARRLILLRYRYCNNYRFDHVHNRNCSIIRVIYFTNHDKRSAHIPRLTRVIAHGGNSGEGLALRGNAVLLEVEALQQQVEILFRV